MQSSQIYSYKMRILHFPNTGFPENHTNKNINSAFLAVQNWHLTFCRPRNSQTHTAKNTISTHLSVPFQKLPKKQKVQITLNNKTPSKGVL